MTALYHYPPQTALKRVIPKTRIYDGVGANTALRERFAREVDQITWAHKLAPETLNLAPTFAVPEIQVFRLTLKGDALHDDILRAIDRAVPFPLIFELVADGRVQAAAAYKRPSAAELGKWVLSDPLRSEWVAQNAPRVALPVSEQFLLYAEGTALAGRRMTMGSLHKQLDRLLELNDYPVFAGWKVFLKDEAERHARLEYTLYKKRKKIESMGIEYDEEALAAGEYDDILIGG